MLKIIPVEEAVGTLLAHDVTEIIPGKHKGPAFRRGHVIRSQDVAKLLDIGKAHIYIIDLEKGSCTRRTPPGDWPKRPRGPKLA